MVPDLSMHSKYSSVAMAGGKKPLWLFALKLGAYSRNNRNLRGCAYGPILLGDIEITITASLSVNTLNNEVADKSEMELFYQRRLINWRECVARLCVHHSHMNSNITFQQPFPWSQSLVSATEKWDNMTQLDVCGNWHKRDTPTVKQKWTAKTNVMLSSPQSGGVYFLHSMFHVKMGGGE